MKLLDEGKGGRGGVLGGSPKLEEEGRSFQALPHHCLPHTNFEGEIGTEKERKKRVVFKF